MLHQAHTNCSKQASFWKLVIIQLKIKILSEGFMTTNFISKSWEFIQLLICEKSRGLFLFERKEKKNCKSTLTPKMPFVARFSCCATIDFNSILKFFPMGYDDKFYIKISGIYPTIDLWKIAIPCTFQIVQQGPCHCFGEIPLSNCFPCKLMQELWNHRSQLSQSKCKD